MRRIQHGIPVTQIKDHLANRRASERERFLAIVCNENPYAAVWQPAEGTCEWFAAQDQNRLVATVGKKIQAHE